MRRCLCPGSFDPITLGHVDVVRRAAALFDEVVVAVLHNPAKSTLFTPDERVDLARRAVADIAGVRVRSAPVGLLVDLARELDAQAVVKGLRDSADLAYELPMADMNRHLSGLETVLVCAAPELRFVSSSLVKEVAAHGGDVTPFVGAETARTLVARLAAGDGRSVDLG